MPRFVEEEEGKSAMASPLVSLISSTSRCCATLAATVVAKDENSLSTAADATAEAAVGAAFMQIRKFRRPKMNKLLMPTHPTRKKRKPDLRRGTIESRAPPSVHRSLEEDIRHLAIELEEEVAKRNMEKWSMKFNLKPVVINVTDIGRTGEFVTIMKNLYLLKTPTAIEEIIEEAGRDDDAASIVERLQHNHSPERGTSPEHLVNNAAEQQHEEAPCQAVQEKMENDAVVLSPSSAVDDASAAEFEQVSTGIESKVIYFGSDGNNPITPSATTPATSIEEGRMYIAEEEEEEGESPGPPSNEEEANYCNSNEQKAATTSLNVSTATVIWTDKYEAISPVSEPIFTSSPSTEFNDNSEIPQLFKSLINNPPAVDFGRFFKQPETSGEQPINTGLQQVQIDACDTSHLPHAVPMPKMPCAKCRNHGIINKSSKLHSQICPFQTCNCAKCLHINRRRRKNHSKTLVSCDPHLPHPPNVWPNPNFPPFGAQSGTVSHFGPYPPGRPHLIHQQQQNQLLLAMQHGKPVIRLPLLYAFDPSIAAGPFPQRYSSPSFSYWTHPSSAATPPAFSGCSPNVSHLFSVPRAEFCGQLFNSDQSEYSFPSAPSFSHHLVLPTISLDLSRASCDLVSSSPPELSPIKTSSAVRPISVAASDSTETSFQSEIGRTIRDLKGESLMATFDETLAELKRGVERLSHVADATLKLIPSRTSTPQKRMQSVITRVPVKMFEDTLPSASSANCCPPALKTSEAMMSQEANPKTDETVARCSQKKAFSNRRAAGDDVIRLRFPFKKRRLNFSDESQFCDSANDPMTSASISGLPQQVPHSLQISFAPSSSQEPPPAHHFWLPPRPNFDWPTGDKK